MSLGAEKTVAWESRKNVKKLLRDLKGEGVSLIALEQDARSIDYKKAHPTLPTALIVGNEVTGLSRNILTLCDTVVEIPMRGNKESLNVSVAAGIALFRLFDRY